MKNIFKLFTAAILFTGLASCEDEQDLVYVTPEASFSILTPVSGEGVVLSADAPQNPALVLAWEDMDYTSPTEVTYTVQMVLNGNDFSEPINLTSTTNTYASIDAESLNEAVIGAGLVPFEEGGIDIRIMSNVGTQPGMEAYSDTVVYLVTPYSTDAPILWVPGSYQPASGYGTEWTQADAPQLLASGVGESDFEGYVYFAEAMTNPDEQGFKLSTQDNWDGTNYGMGADAGTLAADGSNIISDAGYYLVRANTETLTYTLTNTDWGLIGSATAGVTGGDGWVTDADLTYDEEAKTWSITIELGDGAIKFRANDDWGLNYGDNDADMSLEEGGADINVTAGNYTITLDLSNPRAYTYTLQEN